MFGLSFMTLRACCWQHGMQMALICAMGIADCSEGFTPPFKMSKRRVNQSDGNFGKKYEIWLEILAALSTWPKATIFSGQNKTETVTFAVARTEPALRLSEPNRLYPSLALCRGALLEDIAVLGRQAAVPFVWHLCTRPRKG